MTVEPIQQCAKPARSRKPDYIGAIIVNAIILLIVNQILNWGWFPFLTQDFRQVLPIQNAQLIAVIAINFLFLLYDRQWFVSLLRIGANALGIAVVLRFLSVFPFDFSAYTGFDWAFLARLILILGIVGLGIAIIVEFIQFIVGMVRGK
jgi:hypothetical protein